MPKVKKPGAGRAFQRVPTHPGEIVHGRRAITPETSLRLARYFGNSPEFWLNLQQSFDLTRTRSAQAEQINREVQAYMPEQ